MAKYRKSVPTVLAAALVLALAGQGRAGTLDEAFASRPVPGLTLASLDVPVMRAGQPKPAAPAQELAVPAPASGKLGAPEKGFWDRTREFFGF